ncbi:hypothetical protein Hte_005881 [Hypoxylon texense]
MSGRPSASPRGTNNFRASNCMPDGVYDGNENLEVVLANGSYGRPFWWPDQPPATFSRVAHDRNAPLSQPGDIREYKQYWSLYANHDKVEDIPSRIWERKIHDTLMALAPYCGFGGGTGIDKVVYFLDTAGYFAHALLVAADIFGPVRSYLQQAYRSEGDRGKKQSVVTTPTVFNNILSVHRGEVPGWEEWVSSARNQSDHRCEPPTALTRCLEAGGKVHYTTAWTWAVMAGCLRLLERYPALFVETSAGSQDVFAVTPILLGHSGEDWHRAIVLWRWFSKRRNAMRYQTAGKKRPSGNNVNRPLTLAWYKGDGIVRDELEGSIEHEAEIDFQSFATELRPSMQASGMDDGDGALLREYAAYRKLGAAERKDFALLHTTAVEEYRVLLYRDNTYARRLDQLHRMSERQKDMLCRLLIERVDKLEFGPEPSIAMQTRLIEGALTRANENEPGFSSENGGVGGGDGADLADQREGTYVPHADEFLDDVEVMGRNARRNYDRRRADYAYILDQTFGGNDTNEMTVREAEEITGWTLDDPRVNPARSESLRLMPHQIVDIAQILGKLSKFPNAALLASACGIGKTHINLGTIVQINRKNLSEHQRKVGYDINGSRPIRFRPSLILCPASLVMNTYRQVVTGFPDDLVPHIYYGSPSDHGSSLMQQAVVPKDAFSSFVESLREDDPNSAKHVFISSYFTFLRRSMRVTTKSRHELTEQDRLHLGFGLAHNPRSRGASPLSSQSDDIRAGDEKGAEIPVDVYLDDEETRRLYRSDGESSQDSTDEDTRPADEARSHTNRVDNEKPDLPRQAEGRKRSAKTFVLFSPTYNKVFSTLVLDEAHIVRNRTSNLHRMVKVIRRDHLLLCTATPMLNNPTDVLSYSLIAWPLAKPYPLPADFSFNSFYGPGAAWLDYKPHDDPRKRYLPNDKALDSVLSRLPTDYHDGLLQGYVRCARDRGSYQPLVDPRELTVDAYDEVARCGSRPWVVNPIHFYWACREFNAKRSFDACRKVVREMLSAFMVKRGMQTRLLLPDGTTVAPGDGFPGACFRIVNVGFKPEEQATYIKMYEEWRGKLYRPPADGLNIECAPLGQGPAPAAPTKRANPAAFRQLLLPAFNLNNAKLLEPTERTAALVKALGIRADRTSFRVSDAPRHSFGPHPTGAAPKGVAMGTDETRALALRAEDGGAQWLFEALKAGPEHLMPNNRFAFVYWMAYYSPILSHLVVQVQNWISQPRQYNLPNRVVIMATMPWVQQDIALCLKIFGWNVSSIRADLTVLERNKIVNEFNDPDSEVDVLLASMDLSAFGLDLHECCHKGIIVQWPWSANHLLQILGRLPRIGQKRYVEWVIYTMPGTLYDRMQTIIWSKYIRQLAVESRIHENVRGVLADIASYTLLFNLFSMPHHRWLWDRGAFDLDVYGSLDTQKRLEKLSTFFRDVGQMTLDSPPGQEDPSFTDFDTLCDRSPKDFVAGAMLWLKDCRPSLSWKWLARSCLLDNIHAQLREPWVSEYLDGILIECLLNQDVARTSTSTKATDKEWWADPTLASAAPSHGTSNCDEGGVLSDHYEWFTDDEIEGEKGEGKVDKEREDGSSLIPGADGPHSTSDNAASPIIRGKRVRLSQYGVDSSGPSDPRKGINP